MQSLSDDRNILSGLATGSEKALDELFNQYYQALVYFALRIVKNKEQAEDIVIESFSKLWKGRESFESLQNVKGFLYITTRNACFDYLRQAVKTTVLQKELTYLLAPEQEDAYEAEKTRAEILRKIYQEIEKLPLQCRQVFELSVFKGLKSKDIAEQMKISVSNVTSQKSRAVQLLRIALLKRLMSCFFWLPRIF